MESIKMPLGKLRKCDKTDLMPHKELYWTCTETFTVLADTFRRTADRLTSAGFNVGIDRTAHEITYRSVALGNHTVSPLRLSGVIDHGALSELSAVLLISAYRRPESVVLLARSDGSPMSKTDLRAVMSPLINFRNCNEQTTLYAIAGLLSMTEITTIFRDAMALQEKSSRRVPF